MVIHELVRSAHYSNNQDLVKKGMTKWKQLADDTKLEEVQRRHDKMEKRLALGD